MLAIVGVIAGLVLGVVAGLLTKPDRPHFSSCCGTTLGCTSCGDGGKAARLRLIQRKRGTHLHPELKNRPAVEYQQPDPALLTRLTEGLRNPIERSR